MSNDRHELINNVNRTEWNAVRSVINASDLFLFLFIFICHTIITKI